MSKSKTKKSERRASGSLKRGVGPPSGMTTDHIRKDGTINDTIVETFYQPLQAVIPVPEKKYIRLQSDAGPTDGETRIAYITLEALGWKRPNSKVSHGHPTSQKETK